MVAFLSQILILTVLFSVCCLVSRNDYSEIIKNHPVAEKCVESETCVRFCCENKSLCMDPDHFELNALSEAVNLNPNYTVIIGRQDCDMYEAEGHDLWEFLNNGSIRHHFDNFTDQLDTHHDSYCYESSDMVFLCFDPEPPPVVKPKIEKVIDFMKEMVYPALMILSVPFLLVTFFVYGFISELRNLHGKCLMSYVLSLIILYLSFGLANLFPHNVISIPCFCTFIGYICYISVLCSYFWLNVMCYDIWSTFRRGIGAKGSERRRFLCYSLYAFGIPTSLVTLIYVFEKAEIIPKEFRPVIGVERCWVQKSQEFVYVYFPILILLLLNTFFYSITAYKIYQVRKETSVVRKGDNSRHSKIDLDKARFFLYLRLFCVMGATWTIDILSWALQETNKELSAILHITDIINCIQGILIFVLFVWKPKVKKLILRKCALSAWQPSSSFSRRTLSRTETSSVGMSVAYTTQNSAVNNTRLTAISRQNSEY